MTNDQLAADAEEQIRNDEPWTGPSEQTRANRRAIIKAAIDKAMQAWLTSGNPSDHPLPRAAHASEAKLVRATTEGEEHYYVPPTPAHASEEHKIKAEDTPA